MNPQLLLVLAMLACPIGMGLMMWWMMKGSKNEPGQASTIHQTQAEKLAVLRAKHVALTAEIDEATRSAKLEAKHAELRQSQTSSPETPDAPATQSGD